MRLAILPILLTAACAAGVATPPAQTPASEFTAIPVDLPTAEELKQVALVLKVSVLRDGRYLIDGAALPSDDAISDRVRAALKDDPKLRVIIAADKGVPFDRVIRAMDRIVRGGALHVAFAVAPAEGVRPQAIGNDWACPFPPEADKPEVNEARVPVVITVSASGAVERVDVSEDPGHGFAAAATRCASAQRFSPGRDSDGRPVRATTNVVVHFVR
jgi:biopolymer transport protein ExbD